MYVSSQNVALQWALDQIKQPVYGSLQETLDALGRDVTAGDTWARRGFQYLHIYCDTLSLPASISGLSRISVPKNVRWCCVFARSVVAEGSKSKLQPGPRQLQFDCEDVSIALSCVTSYRTFWKALTEREIL